MERGKIPEQFAGENVTQTLNRTLSKKLSK
jgi:hypothetical protein